MNGVYEQYFCTLDINEIFVKTEFRLYMSGDNERCVGEHYYKLDYPLVDVYIANKRRFTLYLDSLGFNETKEN